MTQIQSGDKQAQSGGNHAPSVDQRIADELGVAVRQVSAAVELLDGGATVPFIARYRKEVTGTLDDAQLRTLDERLRYLRELDERRDAIITEIKTQGKLTDELEGQIRAADSKARLEDLYLPYKPKRRTKAQIAREAGLEPLADLLLLDPGKNPQREATNFVDAGKGVDDTAQALDGARAILVERFGEDADLLGELREAMAARGKVSSKVRAGQEPGARRTCAGSWSPPWTAAGSSLPTLSPSAAGSRTPPAGPRRPPGPPPAGTSASPRSTRSSATAMLRQRICGRCSTAAIPGSSARRLRCTGMVSQRR